MTIEIGSNLSVLVMFLVFVISCLIFLYRMR